MDRNIFKEIHNQSLHNIVCNKRCNAKEHNEKGFIIPLLILVFTNNNLDQDNDGNKKYINTLSAIV